MMRSISATQEKAVLFVLSLVVVDQCAHAAFGPTASHRRRPIRGIASSPQTGADARGSTPFAAPPLRGEASILKFDDDEEERAASSDRRAALAKVARSCLFGTAGPALLSPSPSTAAAAAEYIDEAPPSLYLAQPMGPPGSSDSRPSAPPEFLLPAARVKVYLDTAAEAAAELVGLQDAQGKQSAADPELNVRSASAIALLDRLLATPPSFVRSSDPKRKIDASGRFLGEFDLARRKQEEREDRRIEVGLAPRAFEVFELSGERRQWNRLQKQERAREDASEVRRAFNIYTSNLVFNEEQYKFKGSKEEKSKLIRDDKLPTVTSVIRSDLDLRDLYRNQVQTGLEDVWAEYQFQVKQKSGGSNFDGTELLNLLRDAQVACDKWFTFISEEEARYSLEMAQRESSQWYMVQ